jgi:hypothetical protein
MGLDFLHNHGEGFVMARGVVSGWYHGAAILT